MKTELQVSDIAMYLPYGLTFLNTHGEVKELDTIAGESVNIKGRGCVHGMYCDLSDIKPLLRPLSDMGNYGSDLPSSHKLNLLLCGGKDYGRITVEVYKGELSITSEGIDDYRSDTIIDYSVLLRIHNFLIENLFDINDLIGQGLAVDINTLK